MGSCFKLTAEWTVYTVEASRAALQEWVAQQALQPPPVLDLSAADVTDVDGAGLQLLAALGAQGLAWRLVDASDAFTQACHSLGLQSWLSPLAEPLGEAAP